MAKAETTNTKREALARDSALNPHPKAVRDPLFADSPFFDPADLVQVRYEMVRRHEVDGQVISAVATNFGVSRPTFYKAQTALATTGLAGLLPAQRGPKAAHKLSAEILTFDADLRSKTPEISMSQRLDAIEVRFGVTIHRRSLERALARKKMTRASPSTPAIEPVAIYETLRAAVLSGHSNGQCGLAILIHRGLAAWLGDLTRQAPPPPAAIAPTASVCSTSPPPTSSELTRVLAGIIVTLTTGDAAAHG